LRDGIAMESALQSIPFIEKVFHFQSIDSTNTFAKSLESLPGEGLYIIDADRQTAGRGQRENQFFSDIDGGLYVSIVCPISDIQTHFIYNRAISLAICQSIEYKAPFSQVRIKWPNDIYWSDKKVCGILLESLPLSARHLVVGFGINVNIAREQFPPGIRELATSMMIETGQQFDRAALLRDICRLFQEYLRLSSGEAHDLYRERLYGKGRRVAINGHSGLLRDVLEDGRLCVGPDTSLAPISSGTMQFID
jgi:BirA family transcriptional regulator, biotin operon repressor / biotin---[acetyl-CoA-carboxylase] ligase